MNRILMQRIALMPPPGLHFASLERIDGLREPLVLENGECLRFVFRFIRKDFGKRTASFLSPAWMTEDSSLHQLLTSMLGRDFADGDDVTDEMQALIGETFRITIEHRQSNGAIALDVAAAEPISLGFESIDAEMATGAPSADSQPPKDLLPQKAPRDRHQF